MAKYKVLKEERDDALERAVLAERSSQLETLEAERAQHRVHVAGLECALEAVGEVVTRLEERAALCRRRVAAKAKDGDYHGAALYEDEAVLCAAHAEDIRIALGSDAGQGKMDESTAVADVLQAQGDR